MKRIGLIGSPEREEIKRLRIRLAERSAEAVVLDPRQGPRIRIRPGGADACGEDVGSLKGVYVADLGLPSPVRAAEDGSLDWAESRKALASSRGCLAAWNALLTLLEGQGPVVNPVLTHDLHALKPWEIAVYARAGLPVPRTLATTDPEALVHPPGGGDVRAWVRKGMTGGYGFTEAFALPATAREGEVLLRDGPLMIQERIQGENVRAFVVDGEVIGAGEVVGVGEGGGTDSRRGEIRIRKRDLPAEAAESALQAAAIWGLEFAAVDFMRDAATGRHFILECNSAPFFAIFEKKTGVAVSSRLADFLVGSS